MVKKIQKDLPKLNVEVGNHGNIVVRVGVKIPKHECDRGVKCASQINHEAGYLTKDGRVNESGRVPVVRKILPSIN